MNHQHQYVWHKGKPRILQDMSLEEQEDFWKDIEDKAKKARQERRE